MDEFKDIMTANNLSIVQTVRQEFWKLRFSLDSRLKMLLNDVETSWLGPFKALFLGKLNDKQYNSAVVQLKNKLVVLMQAKKIALNDETNALLDMVSESFLLMSTGELTSAFSILFNIQDSSFIGQVEELKKRYFKSWLQPNGNVCPGKLKHLYSTSYPVGLILDSGLMQFPFESLPVARSTHQPYFRVPSIRFASIMYKAHTKVVSEGVNQDNAFYLLNPSNNLKTTQDLFEEPLKSMVQWQGTIGEEPCPQELKDGLENKDVYFYFGHGAGTLYHRKVANGFDSMNIRAASIVMGCSSGRMTREGLSGDMGGTPVRFLLYGAPCFVGNLWDVTDKDIDTLSNNFMNRWIKNWNTDTKTKDNAKCSSLPRSLFMARDACKLGFLIGSAPVVYGMPLECSLIDWWFRSRTPMIL